MDGTCYEGAKEDVGLTQADFRIFDDEFLNEEHERLARANPELAAGRNIRQQIVQKYFS